MRKTAFMLEEKLKISETAALMCLHTALLFGVLLVLGMVVCLWVYPFEQPLPYALGLTVGCLLSFAKIVMLERALNRSSDMDEKSARNYVSLQAMLRYGLTIVVLAGVVFAKGFFGLFGVIFGVLSLQGAAYITGAIIKNRPLRTEKAADIQS